MLSAREMAERSGLPFTTIRSRLAAGLAPEQAMSKPPAKPRRFDFRGEKLTFEEIAARSGIRVNMLRRRFYVSGMSIEKAASFSRPKPRPKRPRKHRTSQEIERIKAVRLTAAKSGLSARIISARISRGSTLEEAGKRPYGARTMIKAADVVGVRHGDLTATALRRDGGWFVLCDCKCGNKISINARSFLSGRRRSCGCEKWRSGPRENRRKKYLLADGRSLTAFQLAEISGINVNTIRNRLIKGWTPEKAFSTPHRSVVSSLVGQTFGRLTVTAHIGDRVKWICSCGKTGSSDRYNVSGGHTKSCGCAKARTTLGPWLVFGIKLSAAELEKLSGMSRYVIAHRMAAGMTVEQAAFTSVGALRLRRHKRFRVGDESLTSREAAARAGVRVSTFQSRIYAQKLTAEEAIAAGPSRPHKTYKPYKLYKPKARR